MGKLILNARDQNVYNQLQVFADKADAINIAVAFLSEAALILDWNGRGKKIDLIISLRPPTSYYSLKEIQSSIQTQIYFLGSEFHSKIWIFYKHKKPFAALLGSSNFSNGGLINNTEANLAIEDDETLSELHDHFFKELLPTSNRLQPSDLNAYKAVYDNYLKRRDATKTEVRLLINKIKANKRNKITKPCKEAREYFEFWRIVDEIKEIIEPLADKNFPGEPYYLVLDHFWHWVKAVWYKESQTMLKPGKQLLIIPKLFQQYIKWQKLPANANYPKWMLNQSKTVFRRYLSETNIDKLTIDQALEIYQSLHSSSMPIQRFSSDYSFIRLNKIEKIRKSFKYLLYSEDGMDVRIHNLLKNPDYKLINLASSGVQEINGWTKPDDLPIRNDKADKAVHILGYNFNEI